MIDLYYSKLMLGFEIMFFQRQKNTTRKTCGPKYTSTLNLKPLCMQSYSIYKRPMLKIDAIFNCAPIITHT